MECASEEQELRTRNDPLMNLVVQLVQRVFQVFWELLNYEEKETPVQSLKV